MGERIFYVNIEPKEALGLIKAQQTAELIGQEAFDLGDGKYIGILIYEKYYFRSENRAGLTVIVDNINGETKIKSIASGSSKGMIFKFDWGAGDNFALSVYNILREYVTREEY